MSHFGFKDLPIFKFQLAAKAAGPCQDWVKELAGEYKSMYDTATRINNAMYPLEAENLKLKAENDFMIKFIDKYLTKEE